MVEEHLAYVFISGDQHLKKTILELEKVGKRATKIWSEGWRKALNIWVTLNIVTF